MLPESKSRFLRHRRSLPRGTGDVTWAVKLVQSPRGVRVVQQRAAERLAHRPLAARLVRSKAAARLIRSEIAGRYIQSKLEHHWSKYASRWLPEWRRLTARSPDRPR